MTKLTIRKKTLINLIFLCICATIVVVLGRAPKETTAHLPHDEIHQQFYAIASKKEAEKSCMDCHSQTGQAPLRNDHPPPYRCLFCHKRK